MERPYRAMERPEVIAEINREKALAKERNKDHDDDKYSEAFTKFAGRDQSISAFELQTILSEAFKDELSGNDFRFDCCRAIIAYFDTSGSTNLQYEEYMLARKELKRMQKKMKIHYGESNRTAIYKDLLEELSKYDISPDHKLLTVIVGMNITKEGHLLIDGVFDIVLTLRRLYVNYISLPDKSYHKERASMTLNEFMQNAIAR